MKDPYQYERNRTRARELSDTFERAPLDFHTEEERSRIDAEREQHRMAELEDARERRRLLLAEKEAEVLHETTKKETRAQKAASRQQRKAEDKKHVNGGGQTSFAPKQHIQQPDKNKKSR